MVAFEVSSFYIGRIKIWQFCSSISDVIDVFNDYSFHMVSCCGAILCHVSPMPTPCSRVIHCTLKTISFIFLAGST